MKAKTEHAIRESKRCLRRSEAEPKQRLASGNRSEAEISAFRELQIKIKEQSYDSDADIA